jgi:hypothetical protein
VDEFIVFKKALEYLRSKDTQYIATLISSLSESEKKQLNAHLQTQRQEIIGKNGVKLHPPRMILDVSKKRAKTATQGFGGLKK